GRIHTEVSDRHPGEGRGPVPFAAPPTPAAQRDPGLGCLALQGDSTRSLRSSPELTLPGLSVVSGAHNRRLPSLLGPVTPAQAGAAIGRIHTEVSDRHPGEGRGPVPFPARA